MANHPNYVCTGCKLPPAPTQDEARELLTVVKVNFQGMGKNAQTIRSRVVAWLCPTCLNAYPQYNLQPFRAPGNSEELAS